MIQILKGKVSLYIIPLLLCIMYVLESYYKVVFFYSGKTTDLLQITKGIVFVGFLAYILKRQAKTLWLTSILFLTFAIGQWALPSIMLKPALIAFIKLIFPLILLIFFSVFELSNKQKVVFFKVFEYIIVFNSVLILVGFLFNVKVFNTYIGSRFGYNGFFLTSATGSYVYSIVLIYLLARYKHTVFKKPTNLIIILSIILIGTKVLYIFLTSFFFVYLWCYSKINRNVLIGSTLGLGLLGLYVFFYKYGIFNEIRQRDGLLSSLMSFRNDLLLEQTIPFIKGNWNVINYLFGGVSDLSTKSQIEFFDIFYFFGILGGILYFYIFFKTFLVFKTEIQISVLLVVLFILILLAGNFFSYTSVAIYIVVLREYFKKSDLSVTKNNGMI
ncbi:hypothetical protein [Formosa sp. S-31]|uniref:hypothetical protein n=1 Tax=Formosa sp. S-31 TaxID=2790949 RepID=UPI003EB8537F